MLFAVAKGRDLTKLDIKNRTGFSMSTVLFAVDSLKKSGFLSVESHRVSTGGKPHSVINVALDRVVYGVSYKAHVLTAVAISIKGEKLGERFVRVSESSAPPFHYVEKLLRELMDQCPPPAAVALAVNCGEKDAIVRRIEELCGVKCFPTSNIEGAAYRVLWTDGVAPIAVIGIGNRIKCAILAENSRVTDVGVLPCPSAYTSSGGRYEDVLSAGKVEDCLRKRKYRDVYRSHKGHWEECEDTSDYSALVGRTISLLTDTVDTFLAPERIYLFGDYITQGFFDRITKLSGCGNKLCRMSAERSDLAYGAAIFALTEGVFNR